MNTYPLTGVFLFVFNTRVTVAQFQTYPEDAPGVDTECQATVWVAFARYDAFSLEDDEYAFNDSGRCAYVTTSLVDAEKTFDTWCNGGFHPDTVCFSVRRGCVEAYPSVDDPTFEETLGYADDVSWSEDLDDVFNPPAR